MTKLVEFKAPFTNPPPGAEATGAYLNGELLKVAETYGPLAALWVTMAMQCAVLAAVVNQGSHDSRLSSFIDRGIGGIIMSGAHACGMDDEARTALHAIARDLASHIVDAATAHNKADLASMPVGGNA